ncbi:MAG TPA: hypothetical protein PKH95_00585 [Candidatus Magasanikbacteria bacterium]|nr:hypothetical protein [Candidatus Magasanikbacteria bacterium]
MKEKFKYFWEEHVVGIALVGGITALSILLIITGAIGRAGMEIFWFLKGEKS